MRRTLLSLLALIVAVAPVHAVSTTATPVHHGVLRIAKSRGTMNRQDGMAEVAVKRWALVLSPSSNGVFPDQEPIVIAIGEDNFRLEAGALRAKGHVFRYKAPKRPALVRGVRSITVRKQGNGSYLVNFTVKGVQLFDLQREAPVCRPTAFIIGDDDGFVGVKFNSPGAPFRFSRRVIVGQSTCPAEEWPWA